MHIGIDFRSATFSKSGIGVHTYQLVKNLLEIDKSNNYFLFTDRSISLPFLEAENAKIYPILQKNRIVWEQISLPFVANRLAIDLLHRPIDVGGTLIPLHAKYIVTVHDLIPLIMKDIYLKRPFHRTYYYLKLLQTRKQANHVITVSHYSKGDLVKYLGLKNAQITVIHNCFSQSTSESENGSVDLTSLPSNLFNLSPKRYILGIGGSEYRKNNLSLIRAFENLIIEQPDFSYQLAIVGKKWRGSTVLQDYVNSRRLNDKVLLLEQVSDQELHQLYKNAAVFVYPSLCEGFGIPILEAMSYGIPTITSNSSALPEVAHQAALLVDPMNIEALGQAIMQVLADPSLSAKLCMLGKKNIERFQCKRMAQETLAVYQSLSSPR